MGKSLQMHQGQESENARGETGPKWNPRKNKNGTKPYKWTKRGKRKPKQTHAENATKIHQQEKWEEQDNNVIFHIAAQTLPPHIMTKRKRHKESILNQASKSSENDQEIIAEFPEWFKQEHGEIGQLRTHGPETLLTLANWNSYIDKIRNSTEMIWYTWVKNGNSGNHLTIYDAEAKRRIGSEKKNPYNPRRNYSR